MAKGQAGTRMEPLEVREKPRVPPEREPMARRIEEARRKAEDELHEKDLRIKELDAGLRSDQEALRAARQQAEKMRNDAKGIEDDAQVLEVPLTDAKREEVRRLRAEASETETRAQEVQGRIDGNRREYAQLEEGQHTLHERMELLQTQLDRLATPDDQAPDPDPEFAGKLRQEATDERSVAKALRSGSDSREAEVVRLSKDIADKEGQAQSLRAKSEELRTRSDELDRSATEARAAASERLQQAQSLSAQAAEEPERAADFEKQAQAAEADAARLTQRAGELRTRADAARQELETNAMAAQQLQDEGTKLASARAKAIQESQELDRQADRHEESAKMYDDMAAQADVPPLADADSTQAAIDPNAQSVASLNNSADDLDFPASDSSASALDERSLTTDAAGLDDGSVDAIGGTASAEPGVPDLTGTSPDADTGPATLGTDAASSTLTEIADEDVAAAENVPEDAAVGVDTASVEPEPIPAAATDQQPVEAVGAAAADVMVDVVEG